jgi:hypothetical protein
MQLLLTSDIKWVNAGFYLLNSSFGVNKDFYSIKKQEVNKGASIH